MKASAETCSAFQSLVGIWVSCNSWLHPVVDCCQVSIPSRDLSQLQPAIAPTPMLVLFVSIPSRDLSQLQLVSLVGAIPRYIAPFQSLVGIWVSCNSMLQTKYYSKRLAAFQSLVGIWVSCNWRQPCKRALILSNLFQSLVGIWVSCNRKLKPKRILLRPFQSLVGIWVSCNRRISDCGVSAGLVDVQFQSLVGIWVSCNS